MSSESDWLVKVRRYGNVDGESVIASQLTRESAQIMADSYNTNYQTDACYIEQFDVNKLNWPSADHLIDSMD